MLRPLGIASLCLATVALASTASAHVRFVYPTPRYATPAGNDTGVNIKQGPCGKSNDSRTADETRITVLEPGATITVQYRETINHPGFYRISFDNDGQDAFAPPPLSRDAIQATPVLPVLADNIPDGSSQPFSTEVTLPDVECENCTLQLIQVMTTAQTWDIEDIYYTCADIALRRGAGGAGGMGGTGAGGVPSAGTGSGGLSAGSGGMTAGAGGRGNAGAPAGGNGGVANTAGTAGIPSMSGGGGAPAGGNANGGTPGTAGTTTSGGTTSAAGRAGSGGTPGTAGASAGSPASAAGRPAVADPVTEEEGGCSVSGVASRGTGAGLIAALGAALFAFGARRRRR